MSKGMMTTKEVCELCLLPIEMLHELGKQEKQHFRKEEIKI